MPQAQKNKVIKTGAGGLAPIIINSYTFLNGKYFLDIIYNNYFISGGLKLGFTVSKLLDKGIIELIGPFGLTEGSYSASNNLSRLDTGIITTYALYITLGLISILFILFSPLFYSAVSSGIYDSHSIATVYVGEAYPSAATCSASLPLQGLECTAPLVTEECSVSGIANFSTPEGGLLQSNTLLYKDIDGTMLDPIGLRSKELPLFSPEGSEARSSETTPSITLEQIQTNYTFSLKILLLSIFTTYLLLSL